MQLEWDDIKTLVLEYKEQVVKYKDDEEMLSSLYVFWHNEFLFLYMLHTFSQLKTGLEPQNGFFLNSHQHSYRKTTIIDLLEN